eukprot:gb/GEZN01025371.1/.p1 GENE.gb/GEZN01025371.1/~~gb/GEZN01025371.1/.p1  ORF type:complete len:162 (-),score=26.18 gb/GEZN01025371.1/:60-509(-)
MAFMGAGPAQDEDTLLDWKEAFDTYDTDKDENVTPEQLRLVFLNMGRDLSEQELRSMCGSGMCSYGAFVQAMTQKTTNTITKNVLQEALMVLDKDQQGFIMASELRFSMINMGECLVAEEVTHMLYDADPDGSGQVFADEFAEMLLKDK